MRALSSLRISSTEHHQIAITAALLDPCRLVSSLSVPLQPLPQFWPLPFDEPKLFFDESTRERENQSLAAAILAVILFRQLVARTSTLLTPSTKCTLFWAALAVVVLLLSFSKVVNSGAYRASFIIVLNTYPL